MKGSISITINLFHWPAKPSMWTVRVGRGWLDLNVGKSGLRLLVKGPNDD